MRELKNNNYTAKYKTQPAKSLFYFFQKGDHQLHNVIYVHQR